MPRKLVRDFVGDEIVESPVSLNGRSARGDQAVVLNQRITQKHVGSHRIRSHTAHPVVLVEEQPLPPTRVAYKDVVLLRARIQR
jgi:hypothetical protein